MGLLKMTTIRTAAILLLVAIAILGTQTVRAADSDDAIVKKINEFVKAGWEDNEVEPSARADDYEFARRTALDIVGHIPEFSALIEFVESEVRDKRTNWVDQMLDHEDYIPNWTGIWGNLLVGRSNNGRADLNRWLRASFNENKAYDDFVKQLVAAEGNSRENGAVVFLASHLNERAVPATAITARLFLGRQVQCTQCHNHPFNDWQQSQFWGMNAFFRGTRRAGRGQDGITLTDNPSKPMVDFEKRSGEINYTFRKFFDNTIDRNADAKPRQKLAAFITDPKKPYMAETQVNRMWGHLFGFGFTKPIDDLGPHNPPSHPELLEYLSKQFQQAGYDNKRLIRWITASEAYNLSSRTTAENEIDDPPAGNVPLFSHMYLKQFRAEQLYDSLIIATAADRANRNEAQAMRQRATWLRQFVQTFGTDENDESTTFNGTIPQALLLMNGQLTQNALGGGEGSIMRRIVESASGRPNDKAAKKPRNVKALRLAQLKAKKNAGKNIAKKIESLFLVALARKPTETELNAFNEVYKNAGYKNAMVGLQDVFWAVLNSNEFIINH
jgi:hypothetical protein